MKIIFYKPRSQAIEYIKQWEEENGIEVVVSNEKLDYRQLDKLSNYDGVVLAATSAIEEDMYQKIADQGIKQIALTSVGFDRIDLDLASKAGLIITNTPNYSPESIAEFTVMSILKLLKNDDQIRRNVEAKNFRFADEILGESIREKTVGIYGLGSIGFLVAQSLKAMGAKVIAYTPHPKGYARNTVEFVDDFESLLEKSDIITIHSALVEENYHQFDKDAFSKMKDGSYLVNPARGGLVDSKALLDAVNNGKIKGAFLDVYEHEEGIYGHDNPSYDDDLFDQLLANPNIIMTNHIAFFTKTAIKNQVRFSLDCVKEVLETGDSHYRINKK